MTKVTSAVIGPDVTDVNLANSSIAQRHIKDNAVGTEQLANASITGAKIALGTVDTNNYKDLSVTGAKIAAGTIVTSKIADGSITGIKMAVNSVLTPAINALAVTTEKIANSGITNIKLADGSITTDKLANQQVTGIKIANGTILPENINSVADGEILVGSGGQYVRLAKGVNNSVLSVNANGSLEWGTSVVPTGVISDFIGSAVPSGWILANGRTIGSAASTATSTKGDTVYNLYLLLWNSLTNTHAPVSGGRGSSAAADWAANKTLTLPDMRGRVGVGLDSMGFSASQRINLESLTSDTLGSSGGNQRIELDILSLPKHDHKMFVDWTSGSEADLGVNSYVLERAATYNESKYSMATRPNLAQPTMGRTSEAGGDNSSSSGKGAPHSNMQPFLLVNKIIKL